MPKIHSYIAVTAVTGGHPGRGLPPSQGSCLQKGDVIPPGMDLVTKKSSTLPLYQAGTGSSALAEPFPTAPGFSRPGSFRFTPLRLGGAKHWCLGKGMIFPFATLPFGC